MNDIYGKSFLDTMHCLSRLLAKFLSKPFLICDALVAHSYIAQFGKWVSSRSCTSDLGRLVGWRGWEMTCWASFAKVGHGAHMSTIH